MSQSNVEVPPVATPAAAPAAVVPPAAPAGAPPAVAAAPAAAAAAAALPAIQVPASDDVQGEANFLKPRLARERAKAFKDAGFASEDEAKAAAAALNAQKEAEKQTSQKLAEAQAVATQLRGRANAVETLLSEQAAEVFAGLTDAQKAVVRSQVADDAPAEDRIKAIRLVRSIAASLASGAPAPAAAPAAPAAPAVPAAASPAAPASAADTAPGRIAPNGNAGSPTNHKAVYESLVTTNPFAAAKYGIEHGEEVYKTTPA